MYYRYSELTNNNQIKAKLNTKNRMDTNRELYLVNEDVLCIMYNINTIGWFSLKEQSIQRIIYLAKVLHSFAEKKTQNLFNYYHFSTTDFGPYSDLINKSIIDLKSNEYLDEEETGNLRLSHKPPLVFSEVRYEWLKEVVYILGLYGEKRIFGFTINDPLYKGAINSNSQKELDTSPENKTIQVLNDFKNAFENTLEDASMISSKEYLELYFEYIFSVIIKK